MEESTSPERATEESPRAPNPAAFWISGALAALLP